MLPFAAIFFILQNCASKQNEYAHALSLHRKKTPQSCDRKNIDQQRTCKRHINHVIMRVKNKTQMALLRSYDEKRNHLRTEEEMHVFIMPVFMNN